MKMNAEVRMKEEVAGGRWQGLARRSTTKAAGRPQGPFKIKNPSPERLRKKCSRSAARDFGVLARLSENKAKTQKIRCFFLPNRMATVFLKML